MNIASKSVTLLTLAIVSSCSPEPNVSSAGGTVSIASPVRGVADYWANTNAHPVRIAAVPDEPSPGDWPEFRGPGRDACAQGVSFGTNWETDPPIERWRRRVGVSRSSFAATDAYIFTQGQRGPYETVVCYEANTGEEVWVNAIAERFNHPVIAHGRLFLRDETEAICYQLPD